MSEQQSRIDAKIDKRSVTLAAVGRPDVIMTIAIIAGMLMMARC